MWYLWLSLGVFLGVFAMCLVSASRRKSDDECDQCKRSFTAHIAELNTQIRGLKSSTGKLGKELNAMAFRNSGFKAR